MEVGRETFMYYGIRIKDPIEYVQGTDEIPIVFLVRDYHIPEDAFVSVMVGKAIQGRLSIIRSQIRIQNNAITIEPTKQMMAKTGLLNTN